MATALVDCRDSSIHSIGEFPYTIGRHPSSRLSLNDPCVSRLHCAIWDIHGEHFLIDLSSKNGTYRNRQVVVRTPLKNGDRITIGNTEFLYRRDRTTRMLGESAATLSPAPRPEVRRMNGPIQRPIPANPMRGPSLEARPRALGLRRAEWGVLVACAGLALVALLSPLGSSNATSKAGTGEVAVARGSRPSSEPSDTRRKSPVVEVDAIPVTEREPVPEPEPRMPEDPHRANLQRYLQAGSEDVPLVVPLEPPSPQVAKIEPERGSGSIRARVSRSPARTVEEDMQRFSAFAARAEVMTLSGQHAKVGEILARMRDDFPTAFRSRIDALEAHLRQLASQR